MRILWVLAGALLGCAATLSLSTGPAPDSPAAPTVTVPCVLPAPEVPREPALLPASLRETTDGVTFDEPPLARPLPRGGF